MANENVDNLKSAVNSLSEQTKKLDIAAFYTHGNMERAKQMVSGMYKDIYVLKGKFTSSSVYGAFISFFNMPYCSMVCAHSILSHSFDVNDLKTNLEWKEFEKDLEACGSDGLKDDVLSYQMDEQLVNYFNMKMDAENKANDLKKLLEKNDAIAINLLMQKFINTRLGWQNVDISIDIEPLSSLDMELNSLTSKKIDPNEFEKIKLEEEKKKEPKIEVESDGDEDPLAGKEIKLVLTGSLVLSPIKGKDIGELEIRDRIRISIIDKSPKAVKVAKAFNAYVDGEMKPIIGRIVSIRNKKPHGYKIFAIVAKGIYVKIEEDEENIKVGLDPAVVPKDDLEQKKGNLLVIIVLVVVLVALVGIIMAFVL